MATTAVREASNGETFLDRVFMATRLNVEVIDTSEESRLTVSAVRQAVGDVVGRQSAADADRRRGRRKHPADAAGRRRDRHLAKPAAGVDPAAGDVFDQRGIAAALGRSAAAAHCATRSRRLRASCRWTEIDSFVAVGGDARFAAREIGTPTESTDLVVDRHGRRSTSWWIVASGTRPRSCRNATACRSPRPRRSIRRCWSIRCFCRRRRPSR